jgi:phage gpG-like protein
MKKLLEVAGVYVLGQIEENIRKGIDADGKAFAYSENPFFRPFDEALYKKLKKNPDLASIVHSKSTGTFGFLIQGYKKFKEYVYPSAADKFLTVKGKMLRDMKVVSVTDAEAVIGFNDPVQAQKAFWLNVSGAGKSRKLWKFLGVTPQQEKLLADKLAAEYKIVVVEDFGKVILQNQPGL